MNNAQLVSLVSKIIVALCAWASTKWGFSLDGPGIAMTVAPIVGGLLVTWWAHRFHGNQTPSLPPSAFKVLATLLIASFALVAMTGCVSQGKKTVQTEPYIVPVGQTDNGTTIFPSGWYSVTNLAGQVMTYPIYSAVINTNPVPWSIKRFLWGGNPELFAFVDSPYEMHKGGGKALFVDSQYNQIQSQFQSGTRFSGNSDMSVGNLQNTVSSNGIAAFGNAGSQLLQGAGSAIGQIINKSATGGATAVVPTK